VAKSVKKRRTRVKLYDIMKAERYLVVSLEGQLLVVKTKTPLGEFGATFSEKNFLAYIEMVKPEYIFTNNGSVERVREMIVDLFTSKPIVLPINMPVDGRLFIAMPTGSACDYDVFVYTENFTFFVTLSTHSQALLLKELVQPDIDVIL
jgi:hypothetical protein